MTRQVTQGYQSAASSHIVVTIGNINDRKLPSCSNQGTQVVVGPGTGDTGHVTSDSRQPHGR